MMKKFRCIFIVGLISLIALSCSKDEPNYTIPARPVGFKINTNVADSHLANTGNIGVYIYAKDKSNYDNLLSGVKGVKSYSAPRLSGEYIGFSGLMIINTGSTLTPTPFAVFDLCCPNEDMENIRVVPTNDGTAKCPQCNSTYEIIFGTGRPLSGPALEKRDFLQSYYITATGQSEFRVFYSEN